IKIDRLRWLGVGEAGGPVIPHPDPLTIRWREGGEGAGFPCLEFGAVVMLSCPWLVKKSAHSSFARFKFSCGSGVEGGKTILVCVVTRRLPRAVRVRGI